MSSQTWPGNIPQKPRPTDFQWMPPDIMENFEPDVGPLKTRPKATVGLANFKCTFDMDITELTAFNTWWTSTLKKGAKDFNWDHPVLGTTHEFRIFGVPTYKNVGGDEYEVMLEMKYSI